MPKRKKTTINTGKAMAGNDLIRFRRNSARSVTPVSRGKLSRLPTHQQAHMKPPHNMRPGKNPAKKRAAIDSLATRAYRIIGIEGGIMMSIVAAEAKEAAENAMGYPIRLCQGMRSEPMADASATAEPDTPPNKVDDNTLTWAGPPCQRPTKAVKVPTMAWPSLPPIINDPVSMKKGMAIRGKLCTCATICCTNKSKGTRALLAEAAKAARRMACAIGMANAAAPKKTNKIKKLIFYPCATWLLTSS